MEALKQFFESSAIAEHVHMPGKVFVCRDNIKRENLLQQIQESQLCISVNSKELYSLEIGGEVVASGQIVGRNGRWFFKVREVYS